MIVYIPKDVVTKFFLHELSQLAARYGHQTVESGKKVMGDESLLVFRKPTNREKSAA